MAPAIANGSVATGWRIAAASDVSSSTTVTRPASPRRRVRLSWGSSTCSPSSGRRAIHTGRGPQHDRAVPAAARQDDRADTRVADEGARPADAPLELVERQEVHPLAAA